MVDPFEKEKGEEGDDEDNEDENDPSQGELLQRKLCLAVTYLNKLTDKEKSCLTERREKDFEECMIAYERALKGETDCTANELDGDEEEIFISMVQSGSLTKHPGIDFTKWAPVRSKAML
ncbi:hypothetical protein DFH08DRAFT_949358 [Mycena albidolilacea]|uniref:Uncharacterized protein n=1 Tax=Mycena albidolilacea TaxID=1033008 RepID=A0AAD7AN38_9AGAR|nr:hypothetical protein DFH08DRAFT_949358 [Mycena albidolilacea]